MLSLDGSTCRSGCVDGLAGHVQTVLANSASFHCVCNIQAHSIALTNWLFCVKEMKCCQSCSGLPRAAQRARVSTNSFPGSPLWPGQKKWSHVRSNLVSQSRNILRAKWHAWTALVDFQSPTVWFPTVRESYTSSHPGLAPKTSYATRRLKKKNSHHEPISSCAPGHIFQLAHLGFEVLTGAVGITWGFRWTWSQSPQWILGRGRSQNLQETPWAPGTVQTFTTPPKSPNRDGTRNRSSMAWSFWRSIISLQGDGLKTQILRTRGNCWKTQRICSLDRCHGA